MAAKKVGSVLNTLVSLFLILILHLGCFVFASKSQRKPPKKKLRASSPWSYLKRVFSSTASICKPRTQTHPTTLTSARNSQNSLVSLIQPETHSPDPDPTRPPGTTAHEPGFPVDTQLFPLRNDIFPCTSCGEIFPRTHLLEQHQAIKHAISELGDGDSSRNIVKIIFESGWPEKIKSPEIRRVLKIHNSPKILGRFEEYRESVKVKASRNSAARRRDERCAADGNELLRFYCCTFMCELGQNGNSSLCNQQYCSVCGIIKSGFSPKMDGISTLSSSWRAHRSVPEDVEEEFSFMNVRRAMLVCRVVAGRVGYDLDLRDVDDKADGGYDSVVGSGCGSGAILRIDDDELVVFSPRAVLPCFVIVYTV